MALPVWISNLIAYSLQIAILAAVGNSAGVSVPVASSAGNADLLADPVAGMPISSVSAALGASGPRSGYLRECISSLTVLQDWRFR